MIELFKIIHNEYDIRVTPVLEFDKRGLIRGNQYKLLNKNFQFNIRKYSFTAQIVNIWNSLPEYVVDIDSEISSLYKSFTYLLNVVMV